ncbi:MAG: DHA2 family efflux MFS transporter permease subunit [Frankiaceae bacterium]|nr:DHA2 family efflux MFS transporter permease subunit [Frankiaceae bacterium]
MGRTSRGVLVLGLSGGSARPLPTVRRAPSPTVVLLVAAFGAFLAFLDSTIVNIAFPDIVRSFPDSSLSSLSWVLNAYNIVFAALLVAAGRISDLLGRRRLFVAGVLLFTIASALCAVASSVDQLIGFRVLQGVGAAMLVPASLGLVLEGFTEDRRAHGVALWGSAAAVASGLGPPIGGALVSMASWRLAFLVNIPLGVLAIVVARRGLVESRAPGRRRMPDLRGAVLLGASIGLLTLGVVKGNDWGWASARELVTFGLSAVAMIGFVVSSRTHPSPILDPASVRVRSFAVGNLATFLAGMGFYAYLLTNVLWLNYVWDYSLLRAGLALAPGAFVAAVAAAVLGKVADRHGHRLVLVPGAVVWAGSLFWYAQRVGPTPAYLTEWLPGQVLGGIGAGAVLPVLGSAALAVLPGSGYATASAVISSARQLGGVIGISVLVVILGTPTPATAVDVLRDGWGFSAACLVAVAVVVALIGSTARDAAATPSDVTAPELSIRPEPEPLPRPAYVPEVRPQRLADLPLFAGLPARVRARLDRGADILAVPAGTVLFSAGDRSDALYIVRTGRLQVLIDDVVVAEPGRGEVLGELGLLTGAARSGTVRAVRDTTVVRLRASEFDIVADAALLRQLARQLAARVQQLTPPALPESEPGVIAVVGLDRGAQTEQVAAALVDRVSRWRRVIAPGRVDANGLERAERSADKVVLVVQGDDPWAAFCLRAADRVVLVASAAAPRPDRELPRGADLVFTHVSPARADVLAWHERVGPRSTTVVRPGDDLPLALRPLAARLAERSLGLALAGGGARAMAHLGVLDELERAGVAVDRISGTSMGAIIAAGHAFGMSAAAVDALVYEEFVRRNPINDYTIPSRSLIRGRKTVLGLERVFGETLIEELPREFRCVSTDLLKRERYVHVSGRVSDAVAASIRLPGLYAPYVLDGRLLVDGGVLENLPVEPLTVPREGPVVAVNISFGGSGSGSKGGQPRIPALGDTLMRTMLISSTTATLAALEIADVVISPSSEGVGLLEWHQIDRAREAGRRAAAQAMPAIEAALAAAPAAASANGARHDSSTLVLTQPGIRGGVRDRAVLRVLRAASRGVDALR